MGRVKRNLYGGIEWDYVSYDNIESLMGLIVNRFNYDQMYVDSNSTGGNDVYLYNERLRSVYMDFDRIYEKTPLSQKQKYVLERLWLGFTVSDIAEEFNIGGREILNIVRSAAKKMQKHYHLDLINWLETSGRVKVSADNKYKECDNCGRLLNVKYFSPNNLGDGYRPTCRVCRG